MERVGIEMRPDKCGVIFEKITEDLFIALSDDVPLKAIVKEQIGRLVCTGYSVALGKVGRQPIIFVGKGRNEEDVNRTLKEKYNGSSKLYSRLN